jgi:IS30 family transposase
VACVHEPCGNFCGQIRPREGGVATLVERQSRFALQQSPTWDWGKEMAQHQRFTLATVMQVYFCNP